MDLLTRGAGFGYLGSTLTSLIYASFTFIFFALEAAILALALQMYLDWPLSLLLPGVVAGHRAAGGARHHAHLAAAAVDAADLDRAVRLPYIAVLGEEARRLFADFTSLVGRTSDSSGFDPLMFGAAATVAFSLVVQIGEQVDYLRFLPEKTARQQWPLVGRGADGRAGLDRAGHAEDAGRRVPGLPGAAARDTGQPRRSSPRRCTSRASPTCSRDPAWVLAVTVLFVVISQVKINLTNAYAGSLAWSNFFARLTHSHPGRVVWLVFNVVIAMLLMTLGVFAALEHVLGFYSNIAIAWVGALVADLVINKPLGWSPKTIEFKRAHLYDINPVGLMAMLLAAALAMLAYSGVLGALGPTPSRPSSRWCTAHGRVAAAGLAARAGATTSRAQTSTAGRPGQSVQLLGVRQQLRV